MTNNHPETSREQKETTEAGNIAKFYGFKPILSPGIIKADFDFSKNFNQDQSPAEKVALLRTYFAEKMMAWPQPVLLYCERPFPGSKEHKKSQRLESSLVVLGSAKPVCDCLSILTAISILNSLGHKSLEVQINSIGDKESMNDFQKNLLTFVKKNINSFPSDLKQVVKKDPFALVRENKKDWATFQSEAPKSIDFLSEASRLHFKEVLEFLEVLEIPYRINHSLVGDTEIGSETVFSIVDDHLAHQGKDHKAEELAFGFRFNRLAKKIGFKKELPCVSLNISAKLKKALKKVKPKAVRPRFYLVQFGVEARLQSFRILKELYKAGVGVNHLIYKDKLSDQINIAEKSGTAYVILIGQKEALDNAVVIRNTFTRSQETVLISDLAKRAKELA